MARIKAQHCAIVNNYFAPLMTVIDAKELVRLAVAKYGSISEAARRARVFRSTLKRINNGDTSAPHADTIAKLVKALNA